jgi:hypothetical protein
MAAAAPPLGSASLFLKIAAVKKLLLSAAAVVAVVTAAILFTRAQNFSAPPSLAEPSSATKPFPSAHPNLTSLSETNGYPDVFRRTLERHDAQVRAKGGEEPDAARERWEKNLADFDEAMKEEPGLKKFGRRIQLTITPGQAVLTGGWEIAPGKFMEILTRPKFVNPQGGVATIPSDQLMTRFNVVTVSQPGLASPAGVAIPQPGSGETQPILTPPPPGGQFSQPGAPGDGLLGVLSGEQADALFSGLTNSPGSELVGAPGILVQLGRDASITIGNIAMINGKSQLLGLKVDIFPNKSDDGSSLDLGMAVQYIVPVGSDGAAVGQ